MFLFAKPDIFISQPNLTSDLALASASPFQLQSHHQTLCHTVIFRCLSVTFDVNLVVLIASHL